MHHSGTRPGPPNPLPDSLPLAFSRERWRRGGHVKIVRALLAAGANPDAPAADGASPLHISAINGDVECIQALLAGGAAAGRVNKTNGLAPIHVAAAAGQAEAVLALLSAGAAADSVAAGPAKKCTPCHFAVRSGSLDTLRALLAAGAGANRACAADRATPLHLAAQRCDPGALQELVGAGADPSAADRDGATALHHVVRRWDRERPGPCGASARALLAAGADPLKADKKRETPLSLATAAGLTQLQLVLMKAVEERQLGGGTGAAGAVLAGWRESGSLVGLLLLQRRWRSGSCAAPVCGGATR